MARETLPGETRVALTPAAVARLIQRGHHVAVQAGAGLGALARDEDYRQAGAEVSADLPSVDCLLGIHLPSALPPGQLGVGLLGLRQPPRGRSLVLERLPRVTRAQALDVLSSQATVAGYKALLLGAAAMPRFLPMLTTAAGTIRPARVLVMGAGVAGLTAIATAHRLGALVFGYDVRPDAGDEVRSLGATYLGLASAAGEGGYARRLTPEETEQERIRLLPHLEDKELVLTCAQVPQAAAPVLLTRAMGEHLPSGAVVVDLAGNCEGGPGWAQVTYLAPPNLPALLPVDASQMFARNMEALVEHLSRVADVRADELLGPMLVEN